MQIYNAALGKDDIKSFIQELPKIDFIYSAPPNEPMLYYWNTVNKSEYISYDLILNDLRYCFGYLSPDFIVLETHESEKQLLETIPKNIYVFSSVQSIKYSAPIGQKGYTRRKLISKVFVFGKIKPDMNFEYTYSHEFLDGFLKRNSNIESCFDPFIGKGLLAKFASKHEIPCYGIEMNGDRIKVCKEFLK